MCGDCGTMLVRLCPCCELGDGGKRRAARDTLAHAEPQERQKRISSEPPPLPLKARTAKPDAFAKKLLEINHGSFGPLDALDLTDEVLEDSEELGQDQIDVLFKQ